MRQDLPATAFRGFVGALVLLAATARATDAPGDADRAALVAGNAQLAFDLHARLRGREGNLVHSPFSISQAFGMTFAGARGETASQIARTFHFTLGPEQLHPAWHALDADLRDRKPRHDKNGSVIDPGAELHVANALWLAKRYSFVPEFEQTIVGDYGARLERLDFSEEESARQTINRWVKDETQERIVDLIPEGILGPLIRAVLTNAIYLKAAWLNPFQPAGTAKADFSVSTKRRVSGVPFMRQIHEFPYLDGNGFQLLQLPCWGRLSMIVILPKRLEDMAAIEKALTAAKLAEWSSKTTWRPVDVRLPKFEVTTELDLAEQLAAMGMSLAFSDDADFSGIAKERPLFIDSVRHTARVSVEEAGIEAAAATAVSVATKGGIDEGQTPVVFRADHPFIFLIRDDRTGSVLFVGRLTEPRPA